MFYSLEKIYIYNWLNSCSKVTQSSLSFTGNIHTKTTFLLGSYFLVLTECTKSACPDGIVRGIWRHAYGEIMESMQLAFRKAWTMRLDSTVHIYVTMCRIRLQAEAPDKTLYWIGSDDVGLNSIKRLNSISSLSIFLCEQEQQ